MLNIAKPNSKAMKAIKNFCIDNELDFNIIKKEWLDSSREDNND